MRSVVLDLGGTAIKSAIYGDGILTDVREVPAQAQRGGKYLIEKAADIIRSYAAEHPFERIGISTAGQVDSQKGRIIYANRNIPGYTGMEVKAILEKIFSLPAFVENDVNAAGIGELLFGAAQNAGQVLCMTFGTGVGGAIFLDGRLYTGSGFSAAEFGGIVVHPEERCSAEDLFSGCYEDYASATALVRRVRQLYPEICDGRAVFDRMEDYGVKEMIDGWIGEVINGLVTLIHIFNPEAVILGGGVMEQNYILSEIRKRIYSEIMPGFTNVAIKGAKLGNRAGLYGIGAVAEGKYQR